MSRDSRAVSVYCAKCGKLKAPLGRSVPIALDRAVCRRDECDGYDAEPKPDCRWNGELTCGPGCTKGGADKAGSVKTRCREWPIIFGAESVRAILAGRKTQTRRIVKLPPSERRVAAIVPSDGAVDLWDAEGADGLGLVWHSIACPFGRPGDRLWVRETFTLESNFSMDSEETYPPPFKDGRPVRRIKDDAWGDYWEQAHYRASDPEPELCCNGPEDCRRCENGDAHAHWRSPIHMPRWASRLTLEITDVRVQRLQEISEEDAKAEGVLTDEMGHVIREGDPINWGGAVGRFAELWDQLNGKRAPWESNPWVRAITFRQVVPA